MSSDFGALLCERYDSLLAVSLAREDPSTRPIAYNANDCEKATEVEILSGLFFVKRLDPRRKAKQKKGTADDTDKTRPPFESVIIVRPEPIDETRFNFTKASPEEKLTCVSLRMNRHGDVAPYDIIVNKYPLCSHHMLLVSQHLRPQILTCEDLYAVADFLSKTSGVFYAFFNSWSAGSSVNHFHYQFFHSTSKIPLLTAGRTYPARMTVFGTSYDELDRLWLAISALLDSNIPHNVFFSVDQAFLFKRTVASQPRADSKRIYGEEVAGLELGGIFTAYTNEIYESLTAEVMTKLLQLSTE